ncbi:MAG: lyase family protein [Breznakibacter sp.]
MRTETDSLGEWAIPDDALYGIHSARAARNFPGDVRFHAEWYKAMGTVKEACYQTYRRFANEVQARYPKMEPPIPIIPHETMEALVASAQEVTQGDWFGHFIVPAVQGGAGTSINMNVNEIIANAALVKLGRHLGEYAHCDPIEQANVFQSTNDVVPTALKVAAMQLLLILEEEINSLRGAVERLEDQYRHRLRMGYTQMQEAVPSSYDRLFSTYNNALSRDWWRVSKCLERIKEVNLGGGAIGTGISIPRYFIMNVVGELQALTGLPFARSENLSDNTANLDVYVEVHATLKAHAVNLEKMVADIRLLGADLMKKRQVKLPRMQVGSSIMPGKVNPVVPEFVISSAHRVYANDVLVASLCSQGCLDLNAYLPVIGHALLESIKLLVNANRSAIEGLFTGLTLTDHPEKTPLVYSNPSISTALVPYTGYHKAATLAAYMKNNRCDIFEANNALNLISNDVLRLLMQPQNLLKLGYTMDQTMGPPDHDA